MFHYTEAEARTTALASQLQRSGRPGLDGVTEQAARVADGQANASLGTGIGGILVHLEQQVETATMTAGQYAHGQTAVFRMESESLPGERPIVVIAIEDRLAIQGLQRQEAFGQEQQLGLEPDRNGTYHGSRRGQQGLLLSLPQKALEFLQQLPGRPGQQKGQQGKAQ